MLHMLKDKLATCERTKTNSVLITLVKKKCIGLVISIAFSTSL